MVGCFLGFTIDPSKAILSLISLSLAILILFVLKRFNLSTKTKIGLIYGHLTFLFFPFVLFTTQMTCGVLCMSCYQGLINLVAYSLPTTLLISTLVGFIVIPTLYLFSNKKREVKIKYINNFIEKHSKKLNIKTPKIYAVDNAKPVAFSFKSFRAAIFLSVGLLDILNKKEIEAILLHELAHINYKSSMLKLSNLFLRLFSPFSVLARFNHDLGMEEKIADDFVTKIQRTDKFLLSAKRKLNKYNKQSTKFFLF